MKNINWKLILTIIGITILVAAVVVCFVYFFLTWLVIVLITGGLIGLGLNNKE